MSQNGYDVRGIANLVLEECEASGREISNLHLNKVLYFMHVEWLDRFSKPLLSAKIEAWTHGPVFREIYNQFKAYGKKNIERRAQKIDFASGEKVTAKVRLEAEEEKIARELAQFYSGMPAWLLVDMSHVKGGAWDVVWNHEGEFNIGMEITNQLIREFELPKFRVERKV